MNLPSKTGLLLSRTCLAIQRLLLAGLAMFWLWNIHPILGVLSAIAVGLWFLLTAEIRVFNWRRDRQWTSLHPEMKDIVPDYWQKKWLADAERYGMKLGDEWRVAQATGMTAIAMTILVEAMHRISPSEAPSFLQSVWLVTLVSFLLGAALGSRSWYKRPSRRYGGGDYDGSAGVGAGLVPPTPTLVASNKVNWPE